jgi:hypothetical protein
MKFEQVPQNKIENQESPENNLKKIQEIFKLNPELEKIALEATKSGETITLYRIENKNIEIEPNGITSHKDLKGQWFSPDLDTALTYLRKSQQTFGADAKRVEGVNLVVVKIPKEEFEKLHVSNHPIASQMDVENDNYIVPENIERDYINLDDVQDKVGNFENLQKAKEQTKEKVRQFESKEAIELYQEYLKTIFPESKLQEIVYHGTNRKFDKFERKHGLDDLSGIEGVDDYYFTDNIKLAKFFAEKYKKVLYAIQKSYESGNVDWYFKRQENAGDFSEFQESTKELWDDIYKEWQYILEEAHNGKKLDDILKESNIKYFENKQGFGFRFGKMLLPYYLMSDYESYKTYPDGNIVPAVLDLKKPYIKQGDRNSMDGILSEAGYKHKKEDIEIDGGIQQDTDEKNIVVFKPEQIHILGSESDIENFKNWSKKKNL